MTTQQHQNIIDLIKKNANGGDRVNNFCFYPEDANGDENGNQGWVAHVHGDEIRLMINGQCTGKRASVYYFSPNKPIIFCGFKEEYMTLQQLAAYLNGDTSAVRELPNTPTNPHKGKGKYSPVWLCYHQDFNSPSLPAERKPYKEASAPVELFDGRPVIYGLTSEGFV